MKQFLSVLNWYNAEEKAKVITSFLIVHITLLLVQLRKNISCVSAVLNMMLQLQIFKSSTLKKLVSVFLVSLAKFAALLIHLMPLGTSGMKWINALIVFYFGHNFDCEFTISRDINHCKKKCSFPLKIKFSKCDQTCGKLRICSLSLKKYSMENFIFCAMDVIAKSLFLYLFNNYPLSQRYIQDPVRHL